MLKEILSTHGLLCSRTAPGSGPDFSAPFEQTRVFRSATAYISKSPPHSGAFSGRETAPFISQDNMERQPGSSIMG
jgi:hypothetical protein